MIYEASHSRIIGWHKATTVFASQPRLRRGTVAVATIALTKMTSFPEQTSRTLDILEANTPMSGVVIYPEQARKEGFDFVRLPGTGTSLLIEASESSDFDAETLAALRDTVKAATTSEIAVAPTLLEIARLSLFNLDSERDAGIMAVLRELAQSEAHDHDIRWAAAIVASRANHRSLTVEERINLVEERINLVQDSMKHDVYRLGFSRWEGQRNYSLTRDFPIRGKNTEIDVKAAREKAAAFQRDFLGQITDYPAIAAGVRAVNGNGHLG